MQDSPARDRFPAEARQGLRGALTPAAAFIALAVIYAVMVRGRVDWMAAISGPLLVVGLLFLASWRQRAS